MAQGKLFYVMQTIFCIWMARSQILTSTCLNWLKYMIILASSDRKQYQYFHVFSLCFWSTCACIFHPVLHHASPRLLKNHVFKGDFNAIPITMGCPALHLHTHTVIHSRLCVHTHTKKTPVALCTSLSGAGDVSPALVLSREIARPQTSACSLKLWVPPS